MSELTAQCLQKKIPWGWNCYFTSMENHMGPEVGSDNMIFNEEINRLRQKSPQIEPGSMTG